MCFERFDSPGPAQAPSSIGLCHKYLFGDNFCVKKKKKVKKRNDSTYASNMKNTFLSLALSLFKAMTSRVILIGCSRTHLHASTCQGHGGVNALGQQLTKWRAGEPSRLAVRIAFVKSIFCTNLSVIQHYPSFERFTRRYVLCKTVFLLPIRLMALSNFYYRPLISAQTWSC